MASSPPPDSGQKNPVPYSFWNLIRDAFIVLLALLPEAAQRISLLFTDKPLFPLLEEKGVAVSWLLLFTVPLGLLLFFKTHRTKAKEEAIFLADKFPKNAPVLLFAIICAFFLLVLHGCNLSSENSRLEGFLSFATNPPSIFSNTNSMQISLTDSDLASLAGKAKKFADSFVKTNGNKPKMILILSPAAKNSKHLVRQIKDMAKTSGWDVTLRETPTLQDSLRGIWIYEVDALHPPSEYIFWGNAFQDCSILTSPAIWVGGMEEAHVTILVNDPDYIY